VAYIVDASVAVKWFVNEEGTAQALGLLRSGSELYAPALMQQEVANTLWKKCRAGLLSAADASERIDRLPGYIRPMASEPDLAEAFRIATDIDHPVYDCLYVQASIESRLPLITADRRLFLRAGRLMQAVIYELSQWSSSSR
jgi:predicted nucleic acid-binding protein